MKLPANLNLIEKRPETAPEKVRVMLGAAPWFSHPQSWNREEFLEQIDDALWAAHGQAHPIGRHLIRMLDTQVEIYVQYWLALQTEGLVYSFNSGQTPGKNPYLAIADKALGRVATLLGEIGLSPKARPPSRPTGKFAALIAGPFRAAKES